MHPKTDLLTAKELLEGPAPRDGLLHYLRVASELWHHGQRDPATWDEFMAQANELGLLEIFRSDPLTGRSAARPRGYAGDAVLLDLIYNYEQANDKERSKLSCPIALAVNEVAWHSMETEAVRWRTRYIADQITEIAANVKEFNVLSVASGHARELSLLDSKTRAKLRPVTLLDQDGLSIEESIRTHGDLVNPLEADISDLIKGKVSTGPTYDLIYTLGLLDYLDDRVSSILLKRLATMTSPGGRIVFANFARHPFNIGYMESAMDWKLIYRTEAEMAAIWSAAGAEDFSLKLHRDPSGTLVFATATRHT